MRNKKAKSAAATEARRGRKRTARATAEHLMGLSLQKRGWAIPTNEGERWISPSNEIVETVYLACAQQKQAERQQKLVSHKAKIDYLVEKGWRWNEAQRKWQRLHWEKVVDVNESPYYSDCLNKSFRLQLKLDQKAGLLR